MKAASVACVYIVFLTEEKSNRAPAIQPRIQLTIHCVTCSIEGIVIILYK